MVQNILSVADFNQILDNYAGRQVAHVVTTKTTSNISGQETLSGASPVTIKAYFMRTSQKWDYSKAGFLENGDAVLLSKFADGVVKDDIITVEGINYRVREAYDVPGSFDSTGSSTTFTYTACNLFISE